VGEEEDEGVVVEEDGEEDKAERFSRRRVQMR
jgi:hypothetical protein